MITISLKDPSGTILNKATGETSVCLMHTRCYQPGDSLLFEAGNTGTFLEIWADSSLRPVVLFLKDGTFTFPIPTESERIAQPPFAYQGEKHRVMARAVPADSLAASRNLALNPLDYSENTSGYPHATANAQTRGEAAFAARNAIDGEIAASDHGFWPYTSWGINQNPAAALTIEFGRETLIHRVVLYTRADFPHDAWWQSARITLSDGWSAATSLQKTGQGQVLEFEPHLTTSLCLDQLIKADDPSPFPALTQLEVWGREP